MCSDNRQDRHVAMSNIIILHQYIIQNDLCMIQDSKQRCELFIECNQLNVNKYNREWLMNLPVFVPVSSYSWAESWLNRNCSWDNESNRQELKHNLCWKSCWKLHCWWFCKPKEFFADTTFIWSQFDCELINDGVNIARCSELTNRDWRWY